MKKVLVISYYWPPSGGPGVQRVLKFCKYLLQMDWDPIILTVKNGEFPVQDNSLKSDIKTSKIFYAQSISFHKIFRLFTGKETVPTYQLSSSKQDNIFSKIFRWIRYNLIIPDGRVGWYPYAFKVGSQVINDNDIKLIFSSGPPQTAHLIAYSLAQKYDIKWVSDFRDPWTDRFYYSENKRIKIAELLDKYLEKKVVDNADELITVSDTIAGYYDRDVTVIHNGYDESDFSLLNRVQKKENLISYVGTISKSQIPTTFFDSVHKFNKAYNKKYRINLIGNIHPDVVSYIKSNNFESFIGVKSYLPHKESIKEMVKSDFLLLIIPKNEKNMGVVTGKIFEYIRSGSTIIMIGPLKSDAAKIIKETGSGFCLDYNNMDQVKKIFLKEKRFAAINYSQYNRENLTKVLVGVFDKTIL